MTELVLNSIRARIWYAVHTLPRGPRSERASFHSIEKANNLSIGLIGKLLRNAQQSERTEARTIKRLADALGVSEAWLARGEGAAPKLTGAFQPLGDEAAPVEQPSVDSELQQARGLALSSGLSSAAVDHVVEERMRGRARGYTSLELYARMICRAADERLGRAE